LHGGPDALGVPPHDFSTNANACGPCPAALQALARADRARYPDPAYNALCEALAAFHGVQASRVVVAASASEFIHRVTALAARRGLRRAVVPAHGYGDYMRAAHAWGLACGPAALAHGAPAAAPALHWLCEPSSPLGAVEPALSAEAEGQGGWQVVDCAYAPLRLDGRATPLPRTAWQMWSPNKALGLTGVRAGYAIAPAAAVQDGKADALRALAPSWPLGADGVALLATWTGDAAQQWLAASLPTLRQWKAAQQNVCEALGWHVVPSSLANFFTARLPGGDTSVLPALRAAGIKLRDCASFGLPGHVRLGVLAPASQQALARAWRDYHPA